MAEAIVEFKGVSYSYGHGRVLDNAEFSVNRGDFMGMIGPNGAGKTTLVKLVLGLLKPDSGSISLFSEDSSRFKDWKRIGYVPQKATAFDPNFPATVFEVAGMGRFARAGLMRRLSSEDYAAVGKALSVTGMLSMRDRRIGDLSGGQQQRVFIARALAGEPELLILDEPTVGVDAEAQHSFYALLKKLNRELGLTLVLVSHDVGVISRNVNRLACVNVKVKVHDVSKGVREAGLSCAYGEEMEAVPHHH